VLPLKDIIVPAGTPSGEGQFFDDRGRARPAPSAFS